MEAEESHLESLDLSLTSAALSRDGSCGQEEELLLHTEVKVPPAQPDPDMTVSELNRELRV